MCCVQLVLSARCALNLCNGVAGTQHKSVYVHTYGKNSVIQQRMSSYLRISSLFPLGEPGVVSGFAEAHFCLRGAEGGDRFFNQRGGCSCLHPVEGLRILQHFLRGKTLEFSPTVNCIGERGIRNELSEICQL